MYQELAIQTLLIGNLIDFKTLENINKYMVENLLFIVKPFVSSSSWNRRNHGNANYFKVLRKIIIRKSKIELFNFLIKNYCLFLSNTNKSLSCK